MAIRILDELTLNRAVLARQHLLERSRRPLGRLVEQMAGIQAQYAPSAYVGLWSRAAGFERNALTAALQRRTLIQATLMRGTIHIVSHRDYWLLSHAIREPMRAWIRSARSTVDHQTVEVAAGAVRRVLAEGPRRRSELTTELRIDSATWNGVGMWLDLVRVPPSGTWERRRADLFGLAEDWVGVPTGTVEEGENLLVRRYLGGFGPASRHDIQSFTGLSLTAIDRILDRLPLRRFTDAAGGGLFDLRRAPLPPGDTPAPVRFIGQWEAMLLVHARRTQILPERFRPLVFDTKMPQSVPTFLVDGRVAGTWRWIDDGVKVEPFEPLPRAVRRSVDDEAARLAAFHA